MEHSVELEMYSETLIPDARSDVLKLLESLDGIINTFKGVLYYFATERPEIPEELKPNYRELTALSTASVDDVVVAVRAFFRDPREAIRVVVVEALPCRPFLYFKDHYRVLQGFGQ